MTRLIIRYFTLCFLLIMFAAIIIFYANKKITERNLSQSVEWSTKVLFNLLDDYLKQFPPSQWQSMINKIRPKTAEKINVLPINREYFTEVQIDQLRQNRTIYLSDNTLSYPPYVIFKKTINPAYAYQLFVGFSREEWTQRSEGLEDALTFHKLKEKPQSQWQEILSSIFKNAPFLGTVTLHDIHSSGLTLQDKDVLKKNHSINRFGKNSHVAYTPIPNTNKFIQYGPFKYVFLVRFQPYVIFFIVLFIVELLIVVLTIMFARSLDKISALADAYGQGKFDYKINFNKSSTLYPLFNNLKNMGSRVKVLISSHKELTSVISHELRTPLSRLQFSLELLSEAKSEDQRNQRFIDMQEDIYELEELISEMLTYAQLDRGVAGISLQPISLNKIIDEGISKFKKDLDDIQLSVNLLNVYVEANEKYLLRALLNILQNAKRFTTSLISIFIIKVDYSKILITIEDDGPGIPESERERVFEPFVQADNQKESLFKTYGIGLAIAKKIIDQHHGEISISESKWGGAKVNIILPIC